jgi:hypothetical protein
MTLAAPGTEEHLARMDPEALYIRNPSDANARGPLTLRQLADLAAAGQVSAETLVRDASSQHWDSLESRPEIMRAMRPETPKLTLKAPAPGRPSSSDSTASGVDVHDLLASAQHRTAAGAPEFDSADATARATTIARYGAIAGLALAAIATLTPARDAVISLSGRQLLAQPLACLGLLDLGLAMALALGVSSVYPLIRFRAAAGLGFAGFIWYAQGRGLELVLATCGCAGIFLCTLVIRRVPALLSTALAIGGMGILACLTFAS